MPARSSNAARIQASVCEDVNVLCFDAALFNSIYDNAKLICYTIRITQAVLNTRSLDSSGHMQEQLVFLR